MKLSIILATYNRHELLKKTIFSIIKQSYFDFECLIIDDNPEDTLNDRYIRDTISDHRIKYYDKNDLSTQEKISRSTTNYLVKYGDVNKRSKWAHYQFMLYLFKKTIIRILALDLINLKFYALLLLRAWEIDINGKKNKCRQVGSHYLGI